MNELPEHETLQNLYATERSKGLPKFIGELYPSYLTSWHYLGTAASCPNGGPGISYNPFDYEAENCVGLERILRWGTPQVPVRTALYRLRDSSGALLYVGVTNKPEHRWLQHASDKPWWHSVSDLRVKWYPSRELALEAEANAIRAERPLHNVAHNGTPAA